MRTFACLLALLAIQDPPDRNESWYQDLDELGRVLSERHKNPFFKVQRDEFFRAIADVRKRIPGLKDHQVAVEFMKLAALIGDGHTGVRPAPDSAIQLRRYPIWPMWLKDGLFVVMATDDHKDLLRARVVAIGATPVEEAMRRVSVVGAADNPHGARNASAMWLVTPEVLAGVGLVDDMEKVSFTIVDMKGAERKVELAPMAGQPKRSLGFDKPNKDLQISRRPMRAPYGVELLADRKALYCWYDACSDAKDRPVSAWCEEVLRRLDEDKSERTVLDLRRNGGGSSVLLNPLFAGLRKRPEVVAPGKLLVLIDRPTYSSAILNAVDLRQAFKAVLVGLPAGGALNGYGEIRTLPLPNSKWIVQYSTKYFKRGADGEDVLKPEVEVEPTAAQFFAGEDPALDAAIRYKP